MTDFRVFAQGRFEWERAFRRIVVPSEIKATKVVGMMLASFADRDGTSIYPGEQRLADICQLGRSTVNPCLKWLREQYLIYRQSHNVTRKGRRLADEYQLSMPSDWEDRFVLLDENGRDQDLVLPRARRQNPNPMGGRRSDIDADRQASVQRLDTR